MRVTEMAKKKKADRRRQARKLLMRALRNKDVDQYDLALQRMPKLPALLRPDFVMLHFGVIDNRPALRGFKEHWVQRVEGPYDVLFRIMSAGLPVYAAEDGRDPPRRKLVSDSNHKNEPREAGMWPGDDVPARQITVRVGRDMKTGGFHAAVFRGSDYITGHGGRSPDDAMGHVLRLTAYLFEEKGIQFEFDSGLFEKHCRRCGGTGLHPDGEEQ